MLCTAGHVRLMVRLLCDTEGRKHRSREMEGPSERLL